MKETMGIRIAAYRKEKGMTQEELATILGVSSQAVSKWENDVSCPDIGLLPALCKALGITADELLMGKEKEVSMLPEGERRSLDELTLRINVQSAQGDKVRVNLPMSLVKVCLEIGVDVLPKLNGVENVKSIPDLDLSKILELTERGLIGKLVEVESADGDVVEVVVE